MPNQVATRFTEFEFTESELYAATRFTDLQIMLFQSLAAKAALKKLSLHFDPANPLLFAQQEAEVTGELEAFEHLLVLHTNSTVPEAEEEQSKADISSKPEIQTSTTTS